MRSYSKSMIPIYLGDTLVHFNYYYDVDKIPRIGEYFELDYHGRAVVKGYAVDIQEDEEQKENADYKQYIIYYEKNKGDWYERYIDCDCVRVSIYEGKEG